MNGEMQLVWSELLDDLSKTAILLQLAVIAASCASMVARSSRSTSRRLDMSPFNRLVIALMETFVGASALRLIGSGMLSPPVS